jgi:hypothetical protein
MPVVGDAATAAALTAAGQDVILVVASTAGPVTWPPDGAGRLAVLVGCFDDPQVRTAAAVMAAELFGSRGAATPVGPGDGPQPPA